MDNIYLDNAATCLVPPRVLDQAAAFADMLKDTTLSTSDFTRKQRGSLEAARSAVAGFLGCKPSEIALMQSTSNALGTLVCCLPLEKEDNILICDLEYQASTVCWLQRQKEVGFEIRPVETTNGRVTAEDFRRRIDEHTKVILLAAVQEINGFRADVKAIGDLAKEYGCYYIVDGIQEAGALQVNVKELGMDFYCSGGKKWLCNPFGMGFLYIREELLQTLRPPYYSYFDIQVPNRYADYLTYLEDPRRNPFDDYVLSPNASVYEIGGYGNYIGAMGLTEAIRVLEEIGMEEIERHNLHLAQKLVDGLLALNLNVVSPRDRARMSSIVSFNFGLQDNNVEKERRLIQYLYERHIYVSLRCSTGTGGVRVSVHYYTPEHYVDTFLAAVADFLAADSN